MLDNADLFFEESTNKLSPINLEPLSNDFEMRPVQEKALPLLRKSVGAAKRHIILHLATAGGKTILAGMLFYLAFQKDPFSQMWFIVPRNTLLDQTKKEFEKWFGFDCGIVQGNRTIDLSKHVQIATVQTLHNRLTSENPNVCLMFRKCPTKICVIDEAHLKFVGYKTIVDAWNPLLIGMTATPFSPGMAPFWQDMVRPASMVSLIKDKTLADYKVMSCVPINRSKLSKMTTGEFRDSDVERETNKIIGDVYKNWADSEDMKGRPFIGFCKGISTAIALTELFQSNGVNVSCVHSKMSDEFVQNTLDAFKDGHYDGVFSVVKLIEGFDYPAVSALLLCSPLAESKDDPNIPNSCNRYVQTAGRGLRSHPGKEYTLIHDHAGNFERYGWYELIEELFSELQNCKKTKPKKLTTKERLERVQLECSKCNLFFRGFTCPKCGRKPKKPTSFIQAGDLDFVDGVMVEVKIPDRQQEGKKLNRTMSSEDKEKLYGGLKHYCREHGYNPGWAANKYRDRMGVWPNKYRDAPAIEPEAGLVSWIVSQNIAWANRRKKDEKK